MKVDYKCKKEFLNKFYMKLIELKEQSVTLDYGLEIIKINNGIALKNNCEAEQLMICLHYSHLTSEISISRNGVRFLYSRKMLRIKKNKVQDLLKIFADDMRLNGCYRSLEVYICYILSKEIESEKKMII